MSKRPTPETDGQPRSIGIGCGGTYSMVNAEFARRLERERDQAREERDQLKQLLAAENDNVDAYLGVCTERDEAREALSDWENAAAHVEADHPDEVHCGCVPVLRKLLTDARKERDDAQKESEYYRERYEQLKDEQEGEK